jgi:hypothetical protein
LTKRQAHTLMALAVAIIVTQLLCTAILLRSMERSRKAADAVKIEALDTSDSESAATAEDTGEAPNSDEPVCTPSETSATIEADPVTKWTGSVDIAPTVAPPASTAEPSVQVDIAPSTARTQVWRPSSAPR